MSRAPKNGPRGPAGSTALSRRDLLRSAGGQSALTLISRVLGLVREQLRAAFLGTGAASDAFGLALLLPNLFRRLLGEGQMTAAFLPTFVERMRAGDRAELRRFFSNFLGVFAFIVTAVVLIGEAVTPMVIRGLFSSRFSLVPGKVELTIGLTRLLFPYLGLVATAAILQAALQAHRLFWPGAATPILLNLAVIGSALLLRDLFPDPSFAFATGFVAGGCLQLAFQAPFVIRFGLSLRPRLGWRDPHVRRVLKIFLPGLFAGGIYQLDVLVAQVVASTLPQGRISALQYSVRLQELVLGVFVISVTTVILPALSAQMACEGNGSLHAARTLALSGSVLGAVTLPATAGLILLGRPIVRLLFQFGAFDSRSTDLVYKALIFHAMGIYPIAMGRNVVQAFYAQKDLRTPTMIAAIVFVVHAGLCVILSGPLDHAGIALAGSLAALLAVSLQIPVLARRGVRIIDRTFASGLLRSVVATLMMTALLRAIMGWLDLADPAATRMNLVVGLTVTMLAGVCGYTMALLAVRHPEAIAMLRAIKNRRT